MKFKNISLPILIVVLLLLAACSKEEAFPKTDEGSKSIHAAITQFDSELSEEIAEVAYGYNPTENRMKIGLRFTEQIPTEKRQLEMYNTLLSHIAKEAGVSAWEELLRSSEVRFEDIDTSQPVLLAKKAIGEDKVVLEDEIQ